MAAAIVGGLMVALLASPFVMCFVWLPLYTVFCLVKDEKERKTFDRTCNAHGMEWQSKRLEDE